ncbi:ISAs1 family transposase [Candidatus Saccharibacteria bacterium]|nr:ISAs1 family transposase [Candidatus Saccharibacteria bacterium]
MNNLFKPINSHLKRVSKYKWKKIFKDPRRNNANKKWDFQYLMEVVFLGMLSGCKNLREVESLSESLKERIPDTTLSDMLSKLDPAPLRKVLVQGVKQALRSHELPKEEFPIRLTAIDGKSLSVTDYEVDPEWSWGNSCQTKQFYVHMALRAMHVSNQTKLLIGQHEIAGKSNEVAAFSDFFDTLVKDYGRTNLLNTVSVDAGMTSLANATHVAQRGYHYIMALKNKNYLTTQSAHHELSNRDKPDVEQEQLHNGKSITYRLYRCRALTDAKGWSEHATEFWRIEKITTPSNDRRRRIKENRYFITNLPKETLTHLQVIQAVKMHWGIENNANWVIDTAWKEDNSPWINSALKLITWLRIIAYNVIARLKTRKLRKNIHREKSWKTILSHIRDCIVQPCFCASLHHTKI